jgi:hypothetical protein
LLHAGIIPLILFKFVDTPHYLLPCKIYLSTLIIGVVMNNIYVTPYKGVWAVKKEAEEEADSVHETREEAINKAKEQVEDESHIVILLADGTIDNPEAYAMEP